MSYLRLCHYLVMWLENNIVSRLLNLSSRGICFARVCVCVNRIIDVYKYAMIV